MNLAIIEDNKKYCQYLSRHLNNLYKKDVYIYSYNNTDDMENADIDFGLIFLNIDELQIKGLKYSQENRNQNIIFLADTDKYMKDAFGPNVYAFIEKRDSIEEILKTVQNVIEGMLVLKCIILKINNITRYFDRNDIIYCQYIGSHTIAFVYRSHQYILKGYSLKKFKDLLGEQFVFCDQSTLVNRRKFLYIEGNKLYIKGIKQYFIISVRNKGKIKKCYKDDE